MATFAKVVDLNGFSAAARALKVPKAAVSRAIAELERELGLPLMTRTTRRLHLTPAGAQLLPHCRAIVLAVEQVRQRAAELSEVRQGPLRVLAETTYGRVLLAPLVPRFMERFADIPLEVELGDVGEVAESDHAAGFDVVVRVGDVADPERISRVLGAPPAVLCATPGYLQKMPLPVRPEELEQHELLTPDGDGPRYTLRLSQGNRRAEVTVLPKLAVNDPALLHSATAAGLGIGLLPEFLCRQGLMAQKLKQVLPDWELPAQAPLCAVYPARLAEDPRVKALVDFLAANIVPALAR
jgi:DNA-binding transcriptional LysR family regulator